MKLNLINKSFPTRHNYFRVWKIEHNVSQLFNLQIHLYFFNFILINFYGIENRNFKLKKWRRLLCLGLFYVIIIFKSRQMIQYFFAKLVVGGVAQLVEAWLLTLELSIRFLAFRLIIFNISELNRSNCKNEPGSMLLLKICQVTKLTIHTCRRSEDEKLGRPYFSMLSFNFKLECFRKNSGIIWILDF